MKSGEKNKKTPGIASQSRLYEALRLLAESRAKYVVVGGVAANFHGLVRGTKDLDLLIPKDFPNTEKLLKALSHLTWGMAGEIQPEEVLRKPFTIIGDLPRVDLLLRAGKLAFEEAYKNRMTRKVEDISVSVASLEDLILSKDTDRPRDILEVQELKSIQRFKKKK